MFAISRSGRRGIPCAFCVVVAAAGCGRTDVEPPATFVSAEALPDDEQLRQLLDDVLESTLRDRALNTDDHAAWQILHGALAYQRDFPVRIGRTGPPQSAVDHILGGGYMNGWTVQPGDLLDSDSGRRGLRAILESGSKSGQGHADQWLAVLAQCGLEPDQAIEVAGQTYTMADYVAQVQRDVPRNVDREWSWTLIGLTTYLPTDASWTANDGQTWTIPQLVESETEQEINTSACGGSHRLIGLTMALNRHLAQGGQMEGPWKRADEIIQESIETARRFQNPDGSFSTNYFARGGRSPDLANTIGTTGHTLEFLTLAMTDEQLRQPWVRRASVVLCDVFHKTMQMDLECGALYHAAHGLALYRERMFGRRRYLSPDLDATETASLPTESTGDR